MTPTEATNRITEYVRQRVSPRWWSEHGGFFVGLVAETIMALQSPTIDDLEKYKSVELKVDTD